MSETSIRHLQTLRLIPREPRKVSSTQIRNRLAELGFSVTHRTVQRDLQRLSAMFPLICDERELPHGWSWKGDGALIELPHMDPPTALTFRLVEEHLGDMLPKGVVKHLEPHFLQARRALSTAGGDWRSGVSASASCRGISPCTRRRFSPPWWRCSIRELLEGRCLEATYVPRSGDPRQYRVNPLGLAFRDAVAYLVASLWDYPDVLPLALHRFQAARLLDAPARTPEGSTWMTGSARVGSTIAPARAPSNWRPASPRMPATTCRRRPWLRTSSWSGSRAIPAGYGCVPRWRTPTSCAGGCSVSGTRWRSCARNGCDRRSPRWPAA